MFEEEDFVMDKRIEKWDILKFFLIFLVVLGHICDQYIRESRAVRAIWICIYCFHMPLFYFIAGLFSKRKINEKQYVKIFSYLTLYLVSQLFLLLGQICFTGQAGLELLNTKDAPWFIFVLFFYYLITIALRRFDCRYILGLSVVLGCMAGYDNSLTDIFQIPRMITFYPFFYLGYMLDEKEVRRRLSGKWLKAAAAIVLFAGIVYVFGNIEKVYWIRPLLTGRNPYSKLNGIFHPLGGVLRLAYYSGAAVIGALVIAVVPSSLGKGYIALLGSRSMQVYVLHRPCIILLCNRLQISLFLQKFWPAHYHLLIVPLALLITLFCSWSLFEKPLHFLVTPALRKE